MSSKIHYATLFDSRYATRALVMLESLEAQAADPFDVTILAMDDAVRDFVEKLGKPNWRVVDVPDLDDDEFTALKSVRPHREFCWTAAPALCNRLVATANEDDFIIYVDADLMFFDDPRVLLDELADDGSILIHEHRYSESRAQWAGSSGRFNVGFVAFRVGDEARRCARRWRDQVIEKCELDPENGFCGDQGYLNEWPDLYPGLRIMKNIGGGTAPWNLDAYTPGGRQSRPKLNGSPLVFFHYHALRTAEVRPLGLAAVQPARGYEFPRAVNQLFFRLYARRLRAALRRARRAGIAIGADEILDIKDAARAVVSGRYIPAL